MGMERRIGLKGLLPKRVAVAQPENQRRLENPLIETDHYAIIVVLTTGLHEKLHISNNALLYQLIIHT